MLQMTDGLFIVISTVLLERSSILSRRMIIIFFLGFEVTSVFPLCVSNFRQLATSWRLFVHRCFHLYAYGKLVKPSHSWVELNVVYLGSLQSVTGIIACSVSCFFVVSGPMLAVHRHNVGRTVICISHNLYSHYQELLRWKCRLHVSSS
jgi:hypothetical protein